MQHPTTNYDNLWLSQLNRFLEHHIGDSSLNNSHLAVKMNISERQFYRKIKLITGHSPNQYIKQFRLEKAKELIQSGHYLTVQEIAFSIGYQNAHYFSIAFEKTYGIRPMNLLKKLGFR